MGDLCNGNSYGNSDGNTTIKSYDNTTDISTGKGSSNANGNGIDNDNGNRNEASTATVSITAIVATLIAKLL